MNLNIIHVKVANTILSSSKTIIPALIHHSSCQAANERPVSKSRDYSGPIRGQYQREARSELTFMLTEAPRLSSVEAVVVFPILAARCSGVWPDTSICNIDQSEDSWIMIYQSEAR